jgi:hypothetical protein
MLHAIACDYAIAFYRPYACGDAIFLARNMEKDVSSSLVQLQEDMLRWQGIENDGKEVVGDLKCFNDVPYAGKGIDFWLG